MGDIDLDEGGLAGLAKSAAVQALVNEAAEQVAGNVRALGIMVEGIPGNIALPVKVTSHTTDRAAATVMIAHPSGIAVQAKHGALTKAASAAGLQVQGQ